MNFEQRTNIKFCFKLGKTAAETHQMMQKVDRDKCLSRPTICEWFKRLKEGREDLNYDKRSGRPRSAVNGWDVEIVCEIIKKRQNLRCVTWKWNWICPKIQFIAF